MSNKKKKNNKTETFLFLLLLCLSSMNFYYFFTRSKSPHALKTRIPGKSYIILVDRRDSVINHSSDGHETHIENV